jgi:hypothetical protein
MVDRIIKGDSGNDVIIQNNAGSRKIEVTNAGDVEVTGDFKATTVKATNLKANDGTASLEIADSTGEVTSSGGLKATNVKATNLKANDGTASLEIADSTGDIGFSGNTNLKIKLPSAGGIYESDGSTQVLTESGGSVTIQNATFNGTIGTSASGFGLVTEADQYRINTNLTGTSGTITSGWERVDDSSFAKIGTGVSESSGVFTFSQTGIFLILVEAEFQGLSGSDLYGGIRIRIDQGSGYTDRAEGKTGIVTTNANGVASCNYIFDVTNTTNDKVIFERVVSDTTNVRLNGSTTKNQNSFTFIRLGNT